MSLAVHMELLGDKELDRAMMRLAPKIQKKLARRGLRAGGKIILRAAQQYAARISPRLAKGLKLRGLKRRSKRSHRQAVFGVVVRTPPRMYLGIKETATGFWPASWELGFRHVGGKEMPARPYLRPAVDNNRERVLREVARHTTEEAEAVWRGRK